MTDYPTVLSRLIAILDDYIETDDLNEGSNLVAEYGMTSLQVMEMVADIEDDFDLSFPLNRLPDIATLGDLARAVHGLLGSA